MRQERPFSLRLNGLSILLLVLLLCITVFAVLSLVSVNAEYRLSQKNLAHVTAAAQCDADAQSAIAMLAGLVAAEQDDADFPAAVFAEAEHTGYDVEQTADGALVGFSTSAYNGLVLEVKLNITRVGIEILSYRLVNTELSLGGDEIQLYGGTN